MKKYRVNVNGTEYEIGIELMSETEASAPKAASAPAAAPAPAASAGAGEAVNSPMPGTILSVNVKAGDAVKKGQVLMILEAMKMENEIMAGADGTVTAVMVNAGQAVEAGAALCTIQ
ncbi:MAG: biotin/lipoyl-binding protein [Clostridia bacterium]|nr:biotin/lipoyl-binding protein [Clostridia bacterium]